MQEQTPLNIPSQQVSSQGGKKSNKGLLILLFLFTSLLFIGLGVSGYWLLNKNNNKNNFSCSQDSDCILSIRIDKCCECAEYRSKDEVNSNPNIIKYKLGDNIGDKLPDKCAFVDCSPCPSPSKEVACVSGRCETK